MAASHCHSTSALVDWSHACLGEACHLARRPSLGSNVVMLSPRHPPLPHRSCTVTAVASAADPYAAKLAGLMFEDPVAALLPDQAYMSANQITATLRCWWHLTMMPL